MDTAGVSLFLTHAVDVGRVEVECLTRSVVKPTWRAAEHAALLDDLALHHRDRLTARARPGDQEG
jgi:hypothetical protein